MPRKPISEKFIKGNSTQVRNLAAIGCSGRDICQFLGISPSSLENKFAKELGEGRSDMRSKLRAAQIRLALEEKNTTMLIWLGKQYLDQKEPKHSVEHSGQVIIEKVFYGKPADKVA